MKKKSYRGLLGPVEKPIQFIFFIEKTFDEKNLDEGRCDKDCQMCKGPEIDQIEIPKRNVVILRVQRM